MSHSLQNASIVKERLINGVGFAEIAA